MKTSTAEVTNTSFMLDPFETVVRTDPYEPTGVNEVSQPRAATDNIASTAAASLPEEAASAIINTPEMKRELARTGLTVDKYITMANRSIPAGVDKKSLYRNISPVAVVRDGGRVTAGLKDKVGDVSDSMFKTAMGFMGDAAAIVDLDKYATGLDNMIKAGLDYKDEVLEASLALTIIGQMVEAKIETGLLEKITELDLSPTFKKFATETAVSTLSGKGSFKGVSGLIEDSVDSISMVAREAAVSKLTGSFDVDNVGMTNNSFNDAANIVAAIDIINPNWKQDVVPGFLRQNTFMTSTPDMIETFLYDDRTAVAASLQKSFKFKNENFITTVARTYGNKLILEA